jgi:ornithine carbamoyltransferase
MTVRHFLDVDDLTADELVHVLDAAELVPAPAVLTGKGVALVFEKPSARTRNSSEMAVFQLGGHPLTIRGEEVGFDVRESVEDVTLTLAQYHAAIGARVFDHQVLQRMAKVSPVPVINLLSDKAHPCQALADLLTLRQQFGSVAGLTVAWVGDGNNVCDSLMLGCAMLGATFRAACPPGYAPDPVVVDRARVLGGDVLVTTDPVTAVDGADAVATDVWTSMGQEAERSARMDSFSPYTVNSGLMAKASPDAILLHCLPAHRGEEVTADVIDGPQSLVWQQAANRMHSARGLLLWLFEAQL